MQRLSIERAVETLELWHSEDVRVVLMTAAGDPAAAFDMRAGKVHVMRDMRTLVVHSTEETSFAIWPDRFEEITFVTDAQDDNFAGMRFRGSYGLHDVVLLAVGDRPLDVGSLILLSALTDGVADEEEEIPGPAEEQGAEEAQDTEDSAWEPGRLPYWPPRGED